MTRILALALVATLGLAVSPVRADFITQVGAERYGSFFDTGVWHQGPLSSSHAWSVHDPYTPGVTDGSATVSLLAGDPGIHLFSSSRHTAGFIAAGEWLDVVRLAGNPGDATAAIRIGVHVSGTLQVDGEGVGARAFAGVVNFDFDSLLGGPAREVHDVGGRSASSVGMIDSRGEIFLYAPEHTNDFTFDAATGSASWTAHFDLPYNTALSGYVLNLYASASTLASGTATADFGNTFRLTSVTQVDGSALPGGVTFDSGFTLAPAGNAVPEPASVVLLGVGAAGLVGARLRRRAGKSAGEGA